MNQPLTPEPFHGVVVFEAAPIPTVVAREHNLPLAPKAMSAFYDSTYGTLYPALAAAGISPAGPAFGLHTRLPSQTVDIEAGVTVDRAAPNLPDGLVNSVLPGGNIAATTYVGSYDGLGSAWGAFMEAVAAAGHTPGLPLWEVYVSEPTLDADPSTMRTDLYVKLQESAARP
ncbi:GyrI-like domain-containing protein [Kocuria sp.]|uniref:GyrI-like domain-containing protein n=1 Tax=Kocuria sp. TaxID=1871328 RepID=UPI0026E04A4F|nr:GyrI-like domain-containing protein [Kocuria sp.]MDO5619602.1 GyrI-like domain-containing protein [Kocuria sp.]